MASQLILHTKEIKNDETVEIKIWMIPKTKDKPHGVKFSIAYIRGGKRLLGYDNAEGKGYHRHLLEHERPYHFKSIGNLLKDFKRDLTKLRGRDWDED